MIRTYAVAQMWSFAFLFFVFRSQSEKTKTDKMASTMLPQAKEAFESVTA
jgi:hypothetical protein